jgi:hypothetical protein
MTSKYVNSLPDTIRIGPYDLEICKVEKIGDEDKYFGMFEGATERITIVLNHPSKTRAADTFLHEIMHAVWYMVHASGEEEQTVSALSTGLILAFKDNKWLHDWLKKAHD